MQRFILAYFKLVIAETGKPDTITGVVNTFMRKYFFIVSFQATVRQKMFYKIDVLENSAKFTRKCQYQTLLTLAQIFF